MDELPSLKNSVFLVLAGFGCAILVAFIYVMAVFIVTSNPNISVEQLRIAMLIGELTMPLPILIWTFRRRQKLTEVLRIHPVKSNLWIPVFLSGLSLIVLIDEIDRLLAEIFTMPDKLTEIEELMRIDGFLSGLVIIGLVVILGPLIEEIVFRGFFQKVLEEKLSDVTYAVLLSALTFAILHFNPWWVVQIYILGFFMAFFAYRTGSIILPFAIHALNNGISVFVSQFDNLQLNFYLWNEHVNPVLVVFSLLVLYWSMRKFIILTEGSGQKNSG